MNRRKLLKLLVLLGEVAGLIFVSFPFLQSTSPAAHLPEAYKEIDISDMNPSSLKMVVLRESKKVEKGTSTAYYYGEALLAVRGESGDKPR